jgi:hypothetical protein
VTSTTVEAVATGQVMPDSMTARAPKTKAPTWENGRQLAAESRTMRPQTNTQMARLGPRWVSTSQAMPRSTKMSSCHAISSAKPPQPTDSAPAATRPTSYQPISSVASRSPSKARM